MSETNPATTGPPADATGSRGGLLSVLRVIAMAANEARQIEPALRTCLDTVCDHTGWPVGHAFLLDRKRELLLPTGIWYLSDPERFARFREITATSAFRPGEGLLGRVAATGRSEWVPDVMRDPAFDRAAHGMLGLRTGLFFPIVAGPEVVGMLEFYSDEELPPNGPLLETMSQIGVQVGRVVERIQAEEALRLSEAKFAGIIEISSDAVVSVDKSQRIVLFNRGAERIFGYTAAEMLGQPLDLLIPEGFRSVHRGHVKSFGSTPGAARQMGERGQITGRRKSGEIFPADASISNLEVGGERIYTAVLRDVTDRVRAEQELARSNAELEQFAYVASHDLQEPLRTVASYTQLLARRYSDRLDDDAREFMDFAVDGVRRMQALIHDLLAFSRVGTHGGVFVPTDVNEVLDRVVHNLGPALEESSGRIERDPLPTVVADAMQLEQVFQNLIANAIKFQRPDVPPRIHVSTRRESSAWIFSVVDNGIGIAPEFGQRIFVLFQRLHTRAEYPGTGIGLAICKKIVERHGGWIGLDSVPGKGTTFSFSIPDRT